MKRQHVQLPSGAVIEMRQLTVKEENFMTSAARSRRGSQEKVLVDILSRCTEGFVDPGPYPGKEPQQKVKWTEMLAGDFFAAMLGLRKLSYREGAQYDIDVKCPTQGCNNKFGWSVDLNKDLTVKTLPEDSAEKFKNGEPFVVEIDGTKVSFKLQMVSDSEFQEKLEKRFPHREMACMLRTRITAIEGVESQHMMNWLDGEGKGPYDGLTSDDAEDIRAAFVASDCGVDTEVEIECTRSTCRNVFTIDLPFSGIFSPGRAASKKKALAKEEETEKEEKEINGAIPLED